MNKIILIILFMFVSLLGRAQTYSSSRIHVTVVDSMSHDTTMCNDFSFVTYEITVDSSYAGDSLMIVDTLGGTLMGASPYVNTTGSSPWTFTATEEEVAGTDVAITPGGGYFHFNYTVTKITTTLDTLRYIDYKDSLWVLPCIYGNVSGNVYIDNNSNCVFDSGDVEMTSATLDNTNSYFSPSGTYTTTSTFWFMPMPYNITLQKSWLINYTFALPSYFSFIFPFSPCFSPTYYVDSVLPRTGVDFPLQCTSLIDVQCYALSPGRVRWGRAFYINPYVSNTGCDTVSGTLTLVKDSRTIYDSSLSLLPADTVRGDTLIWNYNALTNVSSGAYWNSLFSNVYLTQDSTVAVGDTLCFRVYTNIPVDDVNPTNNDYTVCLPVVYSYDPNSKSVTPAGTGPSGILPSGTDTLTYTINFQNTGTADAENVIVIDTLDSHLNPRTLRILGTSATMTPKWLASNIVQFEYDNIMLPDSADNEPASHGQVRFSIALNPGVPPGTTIRNTGYIYFDSNPAVVTNTTNSTTPLPTGTTMITTASGIRIFPNPATDILTVDGMNSGEICVIGMSGTVLIRQNVNSSRTAIDVSQLPSGVYLLRTTNNNETTTTRFTKL
jgi:uncharacterized repeat protein (TIGR01451 family)